MRYRTIRGTVEGREGPLFLVRHTHGVYAVHESLFRAFTPEIGQVVDLKYEPTSGNHKFHAWFGYLPLRSRS